MRNILLAVFVSIVALPMINLPTIAAPNCNPVPHGSKCTRCAGWAGYSAWARIACTLNSNPTGLGFSCNTISDKLKCGVVIKKVPAVKKVN